MIEPIEDICIIAPAVPKGAIELLQSEAGKFWRGRVLAAGPDAKDVRVNDTVHVAPGRAIDATLDGKKTWITRQRDILAVEDAE